MEKLPEEVLLMIFQYVPSREVLGSVVRVCQRWAALMDQRVVCMDTVDDLERVQRITRALRVATRVPLFQEFLFLTPDVAPNLRELTIFAANPFSRDNIEALYYLRRLEHLDVFIKDRLLNSDWLTIILKMKSLVINEIVAPHILRFLATSDKLHSLYMYGRSLYYPRNELHELLHRRRFNLRELTLRCTDLNDASYLAIGMCENLTCLQLYSCWLMTGTGIKYAARPRKLRRLHITGARMVRTSSLASFIELLPPLLEELNLSMNCFGDEHVASLARRLPKLRVLELWRSRLSTSRILTLAEKLPELRILDLDATLTNEQILELDKHPSLISLRCFTEFSMKNNPYNMSFGDNAKADPQKVVTKNIKVVPTNTRYPFRYFRGSGEGYRASLYYYWMQDVELEPIANESTPAFNEEDDYY